MSVFKYLIQIITRAFSLDTRSLSLFRVFIALVLIIDFLFTRLPFFELFYTDNGILPLKEFLAENSFLSNNFSINFFSASSVYQWILFILSLIFFYMLLTGHYTVIALLGSWVLYFSFQSRNFLINNSGDILLTLLLFWSLLLPLNRFFSVDSALKRIDNTKKSVFSINSVGFIIQLLLVYFFTCLFKNHETWQSTGQAVYYSLMLDNFRTPLGEMMLSYPGLMKLLTYMTYYGIEHTVPLLYVFFAGFWRIRISIIAVMCVFHLSLSLFLHLGTFPWICIAGWLALLPTEFWDRLKKYLPKKQIPIRVYYDGDCGFCKKSVYLLKSFLILPHVPIVTAQSSELATSEMQKRNSWLVWDEANQKWHNKWEAFVILLSRSPLFFYLSPLLRRRFFVWTGDLFYQFISQNRRHLNYFLPRFSKPYNKTKLLSLLQKMWQWIGTVFFLFCLIYIILWNIRSLDYHKYKKYLPSELNKIAQVLHIHQMWNMFSPRPLDQTGWIILLATTLEGDKIDLWNNGKPFTMKKPQRYDNTFLVFRMRKLIENLVIVYRKKRYSKNYLVYLCRRWNMDKENKIKDIELIYMQQSTPPYGKPLPSPTIISVKKHTCSQ